MIQFKVSTAKRFFEHGFSVVVKKNNVIIDEGTILLKSDISKHFKDSECSFYIRINRKHRFLKFLAGQVFIGSALSFVFMLISISFLMIALFDQKSIYVLIPFLFMTSTVSVLSGKMARRAQRRISKSLNKITSS